MINRGDTVTLTTEKRQTAWTVTDIIKPLSRVTLERDGQLLTADLDAVTKLDTDLIPLQRPNR